MKTMQHAILAALAVSALTILPAQAAAPSAANDFTLRVRYDDLDVNNAAGARTLYDRLQYASARACQLESYRELGSLDRVRDAHVCYNDLLDDLVSRFDSAELKRLHES